MVREEKVKIVEELSKKFEEYPIIAFFDLYKMPTNPLKEIKRIFADLMEIRVVKKNLILLALDKCKKQAVKKLKEFIPLQPGLILARDDPFSLYLKLENTKFDVFAREGDVAETDIILKKGPTTLMPGPVIAEFSKAGVPVGVEEGRIAIKRDVTIVKKGEPISKEIASILRKLGIKPVKVGLRISCLYWEGKIYLQEALEFVKKFPELLKDAFIKMLNFTLYINWPTHENIKYLLIKAHQHARVIDEMVKK